MKNYIEISQPSANNLLATIMENLQSTIQSTCNKLKGASSKKRIALAMLLLFTIFTLFLGCSPFALVTIVLFVILLGILINEFVEYIRFIREME